MQPDYEPSYHVLVNAPDKNAFHFVVITTNTNAYNDATRAASEWFLTWDILEDVIPFFTQTPIYVDIKWSARDLEQKVQEQGLEKQQTVILINPSQLKVIPKKSAVLGYTYGMIFSGISSLLDPTRVVMDATMVNVQVIGRDFLCGCSSLKEVDLSPLSNVQRVGYDFLFGCSSLKEVDLRPLSNLQDVGPYFLGGCSKLTRVILPASPPQCLRLAVPPHLLRYSDLVQNACALS